MIYIKSEKEIELMEESARVLKLVLRALENEIKPGISTGHLDRVARKVMKQNGATPSFMGVECPYDGGQDYKWAICTSVNDAIIHGIPSDDVILKEGDIVCVDLGTYKNGYHSDAGRTYGVGTISDTAKKLIKTAEMAFFAGVDQAIEGNRVGDISNAIETYVKKQGFTLLKEFEGHGIGREMHEDPGIPNIGKKGTGPRLKNGMAIAIEPMICEKKEDVYLADDMWTIITQDGGLTAYYENTVVLTKDGPKILTLD